MKSKVEVSACEENNERHNMCPTVQELGENCITLEDDLTKDNFQASVEAVSRNCILCHSLVYPKVQGSTENGTVLLHDMCSPYLKRCHLYVGLSRVTCGSNVFISSD